MWGLPGIVAYFIDPPVVDFRMTPGIAQARMQLNPSAWVGVRTACGEQSVLQDSSIFLESGGENAVGECLLQPSAEEKGSHAMTPLDLSAPLPPNGQSSTPLHRLHHIGLLEHPT